jgi:hypothetical protein
MLTAPLIQLYKVAETRKYNKHLSWTCQGRPDFKYSIPLYLKVTEMSQKFIYFNVQTISLRFYPCLDLGKKKRQNLISLP